jgi:hypothetical protein
VCLPVSLLFDFKVTQPLSIPSELSNFIHAGL